MSGYRSYRHVRKWFVDAHDAAGRQIAWAEIRRGDDEANDWAGEWCLPGFNDAAKECRRRADAMMEGE